MLDGQNIDLYKCAVLVDKTKAVERARSKEKGYGASIYAIKKPMVFFIVCIP